MKISVAYSVNNHYFIYFMASIQSLLENVNIHTECKISIFHSDLKKEYIQTLNNFSKLVTQRNFKIEVIDIRPSLKKYSHLLYKTSFYTNEMYYRLLIPKILKHDSKVLYLDCDTIVKDNIEEIFETDLKDNYIAGCLNISSSNMCDYINSIGLIPDQYINSGVLLFNCKKCIEENFIEKCFKQFNTEKKYSYPDQDIINLTAKDKILILPTKWNFQWHHYILDDRTKKANSNALEKYYSLLKNDYDNVKIIHYTSGTKPSYYYDNVFAPEYFYYLHRSPLYLIWKLINKREDFWGDDPIRLSEYELQLTEEYLKKYYPNIQYKKRLTWGHSGSDMLLFEYNNKQIVARITSVHRAETEVFAFDKFSDRTKYLTSGLKHIMIPLPVIKRDYKVALTFNNFIEGNVCSQTDMIEILKQGLDGPIFNHMFVANYIPTKDEVAKYNENLIKRFERNIKNFFAGKGIDKKLINKYTKKINYRVVFGHCDPSCNNIICKDNKYYAIDFPSSGLIADKLQFARSINSLVLKCDNASYKDFSFCNDKDNYFYLIYDLIVRYNADIYNTERSKAIMKLLIELEPIFKGKEDE